MSALRRHDAPASGDAHLSVEEAARVAGVKVNTMYDACRLHKVAAERTGGRWSIARQDAEEYGERVRAEAAREWTADDDGRLLQFRYAGLSWRECGIALGGRTASACRGRYVKLSGREIRRSAAESAPDFSAREDGLLRDYWVSKSLHELCMILPKRSWKAIVQRAGLLGLPPKGDAPLETAPEPEWSDVAPQRKCHDCGAPTSDYRCPACRAEWRRKNGVPLDADESGEEWGDA